jgi:hypothetical protein
MFSRIPRYECELVVRYCSGAEDHEVGSTLREFSIAGTQAIIMQSRIPEFENGKRRSRTHGPIERQVAS